MSVTKKLIYIYNLQFTKNKLIYLNYQKIYTNHFLKIVKILLSQYALLK